MKPRSVGRRRISEPCFLCLLLVVVLLSGCGGNTQLQQQAGQNKQKLDHELATARGIGIPDSQLQLVIQQEQQLDGTHSPLGVFSDQAVDGYYTSLALRYEQLDAQVTGMTTQLTQQYDYQAAQDLQTLSNVLAERQGEHMAMTGAFASDLTSYQQELNKAQSPRDYLQITASAESVTQALHLMGPAYDALTSFQRVIKQLQLSHIDVTVFNQQSQADQQSFQQATKSSDFSQLTTLIGSQLNQTTTISTVALPYVGQVKLNQFSADIQLIKQFDASEAGKYEQRLQADQQAFKNAHSVGDFLAVSAQIDADVAAIQLPLTVANAGYLLHQFHQEVATWGNAHMYHDTFNGQSYMLDYEYDLQGIGSDADYAVQSAQTLDDYQAAIDLINNNLLELHMMEQDSSDTTPYNQPHTEDFTLMNHFGISHAGEVLVVSLVEQTLRYYQNGQLVRSFHITSGQYDKPSLPGYWQIFARESPTVFKSSEPKGSAFWYPETKINFAMEYHSDGYFFHDSWWRADYGVGTNFPHYDSSGDESFSGNGSHGCINMAESDIAWLYPNSEYNAQVLLY